MNPHQALNPRIRKELRQRTGKDICATKRWDEYISFLENRPTLYEHTPNTDVHHILWRSEYERFEDSGWNLIRLSYPDHIVASALMYAAEPSNPNLKHGLIALLSSNRSALKLQPVTDEVIRLYVYKHWSAERIAKKLKTTGGTVGKHLKRNRVLVRGFGSHALWYPKNEKEVIHLYVDKLWGIIRIGKRYGIGQTRVKNFLLRMGIPLRTKREALRLLYNWNPKHPKNVKELYLSGYSSVEIGKRYNVSGASVCKFLRREGVEIRSVKEAGINKRWSPRDPDEVKKRYLNGWNVGELAQSYKVSVGAIRNFLLWKNIKLRTTSEATRWSPKNPDEVKSRYSSGWSMARLGRKYDVGVYSIRSFLAGENVEIRDQRDYLIWNSRNPKEVVCFYLDGYSANELSKKYNVSHRAITNLLRRKGIRVRSISEAKILRDIVKKTKAATV